MGGEPKQLRLLAGRPVVCWAVRPLLEVLTGPVVVVLPPELAQEGGELLRDQFPAQAARIRIAPGGARRRDSVLAGLSAAGELGTVLVHDAARPFASPGLVERVASRAAAGGAVVPGIAIRDTLKEIDGERVVATHDRARFVGAQTPQGFPRTLLLDAFAAAGEEDATDCAALCERLGTPVQWVPGEPLNRKLTDADDWEWAERVIECGWVRWEADDVTRMEPQA